MTAGMLTASVVGGGLFASSAIAATDTSEESLASKIATKFNLNKDEVQTIITEDREARHAEHKAERKQKMEERLTQLVTDSKITEEQKQRIIAKFEELQTQREADKEALKDKTEEERKAVMDAKREELKKWAEENGIDEQYLMFGGSRPGPGERGGPRPDKQ